MKYLIFFAFVVLKREGAGGSERWEWDEEGVGAASEGKGRITLEWIMRHQAMNEWMNVREEGLYCTVSHWSEEEEIIR